MGDDAEHIKLIIRAVSAAKVWLLGECEREVQEEVGLLAVRGVFAGTGFEIPGQRRYCRGRYALGTRLQAL